MEHRTTEQSAARRILEPGRMSPSVVQKIGSFHADVVATVEQAVRSNPVVVVGMAQNPHVKKVRALLSQAGVEFTYLEYGSYFSQWKQRLAIKLWSGWPTFPQVYVHGVLIGGCELTERALADGTLKSGLSTATQGAATSSPA